jgi:hypothetical protein
MATVIDKRQTATIIAALRFWQSNGMAIPSPLPLYLAELATAQGQVASLDTLEVDVLCEALQFPDFRSRNIVRRPWYCMRPVRSRCWPIRK